MTSAHAHRHDAATGVKARGNRAAWLAPARGRRAFSLIEVLLAIFILGIGVISIAALFSAGIAQQRLSIDDLIGPIVANNAIEIIRSKVKPDDFGTFEQFGIATANTPRPTVLGDWSWLRPGFLFANDGSWPPNPNPPLDENGAIDIFSNYYYIPGSPISARQRATEFPSSYPNATERLYGIPYNAFKYGFASGGNAPPRILITQAERYYPMISRQHSGNNDSYQPQYVWDCMFRRFDGKIHVAIFVYRVTVPGGGAKKNFVVAPNQDNNNFPPIPIWLNLVSDPNGGSPPAYSAGGPWDVGGPNPNPGAYEDDAIVLGTRDGVLYNPEEAAHAWQEPRQWLIDQNNSIHRVLGQTRESYENNQGDVEVELTRPLTPVLGGIDAVGNPAPKFNAAGISLGYSTPYYYRFTGGLPVNYGFIGTNVVTDIWYIPLTMKYDSNGDGEIDGTDDDLTLTPVYATVKEL